MGKKLENVDLTIKVNEPVDTSHGYILIEDEALESRKGKIMDKEAQEKIKAILRHYFKEQLGFGAAIDIADEILEAIGYRKLPKGEPPLLSNEAIQKCKDDYTRESRSLWERGGRRTLKVDEAMNLVSVYERLAQAQRDSDIKWGLSGNKV